MTDLHSHILPGIDDGAKTVADSLNLLQKQRKDGVTRVALTPHFHIERKSIEEFLERRNGAYQGLLESAQGVQLPELKLGAEVFFSPRLLEVDLAPLCYEGTSYMLVEFPMTYYPKWAPDVFYQMQLGGITPVIAHVERYPFAINDMSILYDWVCSGCVTHVNATSIANHTKRRKTIWQMMKHQLVHFISTDAHSMEKRPPMLKKAYSLTADKFGGGRCDAMLDAADCVWEDLGLDAGVPSKPYTFLGLRF